MVGSCSHMLSPLPPKHTHTHMHWDKLPVPCTKLLFIKQSVS